MRTGKSSGNTLRLYDIDNHNTDVYKHFLSNRNSGKFANKKHPVNTGTHNQLTEKCHNLYKDGLKKNELREIIMEEERKKRDQVSMKQCDFKPKISELSKYIASRKNPTNGDMYRQNELWVLDQEQKIESLKLKSEKNQFKECTFQPNTEKEFNRSGDQNLDHLNLGSIMKFLNRYNKVRSDKENQEKPLRAPKTPAGHRITVPKPFNFELGKGLPSKGCDQQEHSRLSRCAYTCAHGDSMNSSRQTTQSQTSSIQKQMAQSSNRFEHPTIADTLNAKSLANHRQLLQMKIETPVF